VFIYRSASNQFRNKIPKVGVLRRPVLITTFGHGARLDRAHSITGMHRFYTTLILGVIGGAVVLAQNVQTPQQRLTPKEIKWPAAAVGTSGAAGLQTVVLKGDPTKAGLYTMPLRLPPNTKIQAHSHKDDRTAVVLSGVWYFGYGREFNEAALKELPAGSFYTEPPGTEHFAMTKDQETIIEITGYGPSDLRTLSSAQPPRSWLRMRGSGLAWIPRSMILTVVCSFVCMRRNYQFRSSDLDRRRHEFRPPDFMRNFRYRRERRFRCECR
jgi:quercetin dioxygenase-like cupin family protein